MIVTWQGGQDFVLKTKNGTVKLGDQLQLVDLTINNPGEYEAGGIQLDYNNGIIQTFVEGMTVGHIKKAKNYSEEELENLSGIDILLIGVGNGEYSENKVALEAIAQIDPRIVVPMGQELDAFLKDEGINAQGVDELKITKTDLPAEDRQTVVLNARR